jgi:glutathione peroxidase
MGILSRTCASVFGKKVVSGAIYDFTIKDIVGEDIHFERYRGRKLLIVNTASKCGYTSQYADLEKLHRTHAASITVLGFPSNNFLWQEPGSNSQILEFCRSSYEVTFKLFSKISVKGKLKHPLYQWLQAKTGKAPTWNFCKYLVDENGQDVKFFGTAVNPLDPVIVSEITKG